MYKGRPEIIWDSTTGLPHSIMGFLTEPRKGDPDEIACEFIRKNEDLLGIDSDAIQLVKIEKMGSEVHLIYQEYFCNIPVEWAFVKVHMKNTGEIFWIISDYKPIKDAKITPSITKEVAFDHALSHLNPKDDIKAPDKWNLAIFRFGDEYRLVYKFKFFTKDPLGYWIYYVDANTGEVIYRLNDLRFVTTGNVQGKIFPLTGADALTSYPMRNEYVQVGNTRVTTNANGDYSNPEDGTCLLYTSPSPRD